MLVVNRFRVPQSRAAAFGVEVRSARDLLAAQRGHLGATLGRNVDDPELWVLTTRWTGPGDYRRALSSYEVKVGAWALLGQAIEEPSAYEVLDDGEPANRSVPRTNP